MKKTNIIIIVLIALSLCQCNLLNRDTIGFKNLAEVKDSMLVAENILNDLPSPQNEYPYFWDDDDTMGDSTLVIGGDELCPYQKIYEDTVLFLKDISHSRRERLIKVMLFLRDNDINKAAWDVDLKTWCFYYRDIHTGESEDDREIFVNPNKPAYDVIKFRDTLLDEKGGLVLSKRRQ
jgi:hypothetical protein